MTDSHSNKQETTLPTDIADEFSSVNILSRGYVFWYFTARVRYEDKSETNINTSDISFNFDDVQMASHNADEFARYKIKQKAFFHCEVISKPSGTIRIGGTPSGITLSKNFTVADLANNLTKAEPLEIEAENLKSENILLTRYQVYAPPIVYGSWHIVGSHIGTASFNISVDPLGDTIVVGEARYYDKNNKHVIKPFSETITVLTGNSVAHVEIRLKGSPTGSSCWVTVIP